ncbi:hypothetical protein ACIQFW_00345 [Streptomyces ardesiacus]|uniref:hypothetical protein n=1 Tax=Streptomyces ardesiacus TaxID=285564 RepID=UPI003803E93B
MGDQEADTARIRESARALKRIRGTFAERANPADGYGVDEIGSQKILEAFDKFGSNWKIHRRQLTDELEKLYGIVKAAADSYDKVDHELAEALRRSDETGKAGTKGDGK